MITKLSEKYDRVLRYCEKEVDKITKMFKRQREDPPLPRNYSPIAGNQHFVKLNCTPETQISSQMYQTPFIILLLLKKSLTISNNKIIIVFTHPYVY